MLSLKPIKQSVLVDIVNPLKPMSRGGGKATSDDVGVKLINCDVQYQYSTELVQQFLDWFAMFSIYP